MASGEMTEAEFRAFLAAALLQPVANLPAGGVAMVCMDWRHIGELIAAGEAAGLELINLCVWNKTNGGMGGLYRSKHELVFIFRKPGAPHVNNVALGRHGRNRTNVWDYPGVNSFGKDRAADLVDQTILARLETQDRAVTPIAQMKTPPEPCLGLRATRIRGGA